MLKVRILLFFVGLVLLSSCSQYQKVLKSNDYNLKYEAAVKYYEDEDYYKAQSLFDELVSIFKGTDKAEDVLYYYADCHYKQNDYVLAAYYFDNFAKTFPYSEKTQTAAYTAAYCYYLNSPRPSLDQTDTYKAIDAMQLFINKYPESTLVAEANNIMESLRSKLEEKSYENAKLYFKLSDFHAASISLKNSIKEFPDSKYREEVLYLIVKSSFLLAEMSIESKQGERYQDTISEYYVFIDEYPESDYAKEVEKMYTKSVNQIKNL
ncbi:MAG: outer membrane protein assembly factor BamD [Salinivirgaceae bacterium]|jgi:outer membrane protein assembly factor BamD|nr:outer membrane protein assembly factor BamD [Salinivirgaceae bacterium]